MADIFDVVADATRRDLLQVLLERAMASDSGSGKISAGEISVGEIVDALGLSQPTVSKHLKVLRDIGLVSVREEGQHRYYSLDVGPFEVFEDWLIPFLSVGFDEFDDEGGMTVFSAWAGDSLRVPLRRVAEVIQNPRDAGVAIGRVLADGVHPAKRVSALVQDAVAEAGRRLKGSAEKLRDSLDKRKG